MDTEGVDSRVGVLLFKGLPELSQFRNLNFKSGHHQNCNLCFPLPIF